MTHNFEQLSGKPMQAVGEVMFYRECFSVHGMRGNSKSCYLQYYVGGPLVHPFHLFGILMALTHLCGIGGGQAVVVGNTELITQLSI